MDMQIVDWGDDFSHEETQMMIDAALWQATGGLSRMLGRPIDADTSRVETVPIGRPNGRQRSHSAEWDPMMVGIHQTLEGSLQGYAILILPRSSALAMVDMLLEKSPGSSTELGALEQSALGEASNVAISYFLNTVARHTQAQDLLQPSYPTIIEGRLSSIMDTVVAPAANGRKNLRVIGAGFKDTTETVHGFLLIFPDANSSDTA